MYFTNTNIKQSLGTKSYINECLLHFVWPTYKAIWFCRELVVKSADKHISGWMALYQKCLNVLTQVVFMEQALHPFLADVHFSMRLKKKKKGMYKTFLAFS